MPEREIVVDKDKITYEGLFHAKEVVQLIKDFARDKGLEYGEPKHTESVLPEGRFIELEIKLDRNITDYAKKVYMLKIQMHNVTEKVVERAKKKQKVHHGKVLVTMDGILETDYEKRWEVKPVFYLVRVLFERYVYSPYMNQFREEIRKDLKHLKDNIGAYLNLYKF